MNTINLPIPETADELKAIIAFYNALANVPSVANNLADLAKVKQHKALEPKALESIAELHSENSEVTTTNFTVEQIRQLVASKPTSRSAIKAELTRLGANNVSTLPVALYDEFVNFLECLQ